MEKSKNMLELQSKINTSFLNAFGRTPLGERLQDILREAIDVSRFTDIPNLKEETGDLLATTLQLCNESGWDVEELIQATLDKIKAREIQYKQLGRKTQVALFGGAFNPPTPGHIAAAKFILNSSKTFDEVWLMPCANHMYNKNMVSPEHRLAMCKLAAASDPRIKVFDFEIVHDLRGESYKLVKELYSSLDLNDKYDFSMIIGMDNANTFSKWVNYQELERMIRFVVLSRKGVERDESVDWYLKAPHLYLVAESEIPETSSTFVREFLSGYFEQEYHGQHVHEEELNKVIDPKVLKYIEENKLYQETQNG